MSIVTEFKKFALRGNIIDLTIGFTVGAAFTTIVKSFVSDILMPPIGLLTGQSDFVDKFIVLKEGAATAAPYTTLADAQAAGAVTLNYGVFINNTIAFLLVAMAVFLLVRLINRLDNDVPEDTAAAPAVEESPTKKCPFCRTIIDAQASRCPSCTSELTGSIASSPESDVGA